MECGLPLQNVMVYGVIGASLLLFPVVGWLAAADVWYTRYKMMRLSFLLLLLHFATLFIAELSSDSSHVYI